MPQPDQVPIAVAANIIGAFGVAVTDAVRGAALDKDSDESAAAALVHISKYPDRSIDELRGPLGLSHSGCVRLVDRLVAAGEVERRPGNDGRKIALRVTNPGARAAARILEARCAALLPQIKTLTPKERLVLVGLVSKLMQASIEDERHALQVCRLCDYGSCPEQFCPAGKALANLKGTE